MRQSEVLAMILAHARLGTAELAAECEGSLKQMAESLTQTFSVLELMAAQIAREGDSTLSDMDASEFRALFNA